MTTHRTPWGRELAEARTDQPDTFVTPWGRTIQLTDGNKQERAAREARAQEPKRKAEEAKPAGRPVYIRTANPERVRRQIAEMREMFARRVS